MYSIFAIVLLSNLGINKIHMNYFICFYKINVLCKYMKNIFFNISPILVMIALFLVF